jgi:hypothetical protein
MSGLRSLMRSKRRLWSKRAEFPLLIDHDYVQLVKRQQLQGRATRAYYWTETKFKICSAEITRNEGDAEAWFKHELVRLKKLLDDLDQATANLRSWAESGLSMKVSCTTSFCRTDDHRPWIISPDQLRLHLSKGLSLDDLKRKLRCKVCGGRCSNISVA